MQTFPDNAILVSSQAEETSVYKIYVYDSHGSQLTKLLKNNTTFKTLTDVKDFLYGDKSTKRIKLAVSRQQLVICQKTDRWRIVELINPTL